jgi:hypothetical protein
MGTLDALFQIQYCSFAHGRAGESVLAYIRTAELSECDILGDYFLLLDIVNHLDTQSVLIFMGQG